MSVFVRPQNALCGNNIKVHNKAVFSDQCLNFEYKNYFQSKRALVGIILSQIDRKISSFLLTNYKFAKWQSNKLIEF